MTQETTKHISVLKSEVLEALIPVPGRLFLDCTLGGAGHSEAILEAHPENLVVAVDRDGRAIERAKVRLQKFGTRVTFYKAAFSEIPSVVQERGFSGVLADLGLSTDQLKENRGFSFSDQSALDMRMDENAPCGAGDIVNHYPLEKLFVVLKQGGVGREARAVAQAIVAARPIPDTKSLAKVVFTAAQGKSSKQNVSPATVTFQAIRIEVNQEFEEIRSLLAVVPKIVRPGARLAVITFHSSEDKIVTHTMRSWSQGDTRPAWLPRSMVGQDKSEKPIGCLVSRRGIEPTDLEVESNPSARSAKLRVFEFFS